MMMKRKRKRKKKKKRENENENENEKYVYYFLSYFSYYLLLCCDDCGYVNDFSWRKRRILESFLLIHDDCCERHCFQPIPL